VTSSSSELCDPSPSVPPHKTPEQLARENMPLAKYLALEKARTAAHVDVDDLMSAASFGLARAALMFEPERGIPFGAFARARINWAILSEMRASDPAGERSRSKIKTLTEAAERLFAKTGRTATSAELAAESKLPLKVVEEALRLNEVVRTSTSFETHFADSDRGQPADFTASVIMPESAAEESESRAMLLRVIDALPDATRAVIRGIYLEERMVKDIAAELDVSHAYVSKLRKTGLALMREAMDAWQSGTVVDRSTPTRSTFFDSIFDASKRLAARGEDSLALA